LRACSVEKKKNPAIPGGYIRIKSYCAAHHFGVETGNQPFNFPFLSDWGE